MAIAIFVPSRPPKGCRSEATASLWNLFEKLIEEAFCYNFTPAAKREIKKIIYQHFDLIVDAWFKNLTNPENGEIE